MTLNLQAIADQYHIPVAEVEAKYKNFAKTAMESISKRYPQNVTEKTEEYFTKSISNLFQLSSYDRAVKRAADPEDDTAKISTIILGVKPSEDKYGVEKRIRKKNYYDNAAKELGAGRVAEKISPEGIKYPVPIDCNEYVVNWEGRPVLDADGKPILNEHYKEELPTKWVNKLLMVVGDKLMIGTIPSVKEIGPHTPRIGCKSVVYGTVFQDKYLTIAKDGYDDFGKFESDAAFPDGTFGVAKKYLEAAPEFTNMKAFSAVDAEGKPVVPFYKMRIVKGNLINKGVGEFSSYIIVNDMDVPAGMKFTTSFKPLQEDISKIAKGSEVYVIFDRRKFKPKDKPDLIEYNKLWGVIASSTTDAMMDEINRLFG